MALRLDSGMDWNQNILKGDDSEFCPGLGSLYLKLRRQVCLTSSSFSHRSTHILPYLSWTKTSCVARESFLNPRTDKNVTAAYPIGFSTLFLCSQATIWWCFGKITLESLLCEERKVWLSPGEWDGRRLEQLHWPFPFLSSHCQHFAGGGITVPEKVR